MVGRALKYTHFSKLINICLVADTDEEFERMEQQKRSCIKMGGNEACRIHCKMRI